MRQSLEFKDSSLLWLSFYSRYGCNVEGKEPNGHGWINFQCVLPSHKKVDKDSKGAINVWSGNYRCWNDACKDEYNYIFERHSLQEQREILFPAEFLMLTQDIDRLEADQIVESFRLQFQESMPPEQYHHDTFTNTFSPNTEWAEFVTLAQSRLQATIPIVQEYMVSRGLSFETLKKSKVGYVPEYTEGGIHIPECLIHCYYQNGVVVGIRGRAGDGRKGGVKGSFATFYQLDTVLTTFSRTVIICEGETDTLVTRQLLDTQGFEDVPVLGIPGSFFRPEWTRHLQRFNRVIFIAQSDQASQRLCASMKRSLAELEIVTPPFPPLTPGKDISDFVRLDSSNGALLLDLLGLTELDIETIPYIMDEAEFLNMGNKDPAWIIPGILERGTKNLIVGEPKTYKTWLALQLIESIVNCTPFLGLYDWTPDTPGKVLLVEEEGAVARLSQRWRMMTQGRRSQGKFYVIHRQNVKLDEDNSLNRLREQVLKLKPDVLILDPYANIHTQDENSVQGTMIVMNALSALIRALPGLAVVIIHHTAKGASGPRGSSALWGAVDTQIKVERVEKVDGQIRVKLLGRDLPDERSSGLEFTFNPDIGKHEPKEMITSSTLQRLAKKGSVEEKVLQLLNTESRSVTTICEETGETPDKIRTILKKFTDARLVEETGTGKKNDPKLYNMIIKEVKE